MDSPILSRLLDVGFLTGSRAFGTERDGSDYDICYSIDDSNFINVIIEGMERHPSDYFSGFFISCDGININLIPVHPHEYLCWYLATKAMKATLVISGIDNPIGKYSVFMGIVSLYKGTVKQRGNLSSYNKVKSYIYDLEHKLANPRLPDVESFPF